MKFSTMTVQQALQAGYTQCLKDEIPSLRQLMT